MNYHNDNPRVPKVSPISRPAQTHAEQVRAMMRSLFREVTMAPIPDHLLKIAVDMIPSGIFKQRQP